MGSTQRAGVVPSSAWNRQQAAAGRRHGKGRGKLGLPARALHEHDQLAGYVTA
jgi:hypothetical protein